MNLHKLKKKYLGLILFKNSIQFISPVRLISEMFKTESISFDDNPIINSFKAFLNSMFEISPLFCLSYFVKT